MYIKIHIYIQGHSAQCCHIRMLHIMSQQEFLLLAPQSLCFQSEALRLYFPALEPWVSRSISLPSCSSQFICTQMWDCPVHKPPPHWLCQSLPCLPQSSSRCPSLPLLLVWMNVSSTTPWLSDFHTV